MSSTENMIASNPDTDEIKNLAIALFDHIEAQINRSDTKAGLILAADTLFATTVTTLSQGALVNLLDSATLVQTRITALLTIFMFFALLISAVYALIVARPILRLPKRDRTFFFFGRIAEVGVHEFINGFSCQTPQQVRQNILNEIYTVSLIANKKFARVQRSFDFLIIALALWAIIQVFLAMSR